LVVSATDVAVTEKSPVLWLAVKTPDDEIVPPVAVHVTAVLELPVTVAENGCVWPGGRVALVGDTVTDTTGGGGGGAWMVTLAEADFDGSAADVAVTVKLLPAVEPAVNRPVLEIVPPVADHVTALLELPLTVALNWRVCPV
jgi:hypothetical protein